MIQMCIDYSNGVVILKYTYNRQLAWYIFCSKRNFAILLTICHVDKWKVVMVDSGCVPHLLSVKDAQYQQKFIDLVVLMLMEGEVTVIYT